MSRSRTAVLRAQLNAIAEELARIESRPEEPPQGSVIRFNMQFGGRGTVYEYAAIHAGNGLWYATGPRSATQGYRWDALLDWMDGNTHAFQILRPPARSVEIELES